MGQPRRRSHANTHAIGVSDLLRWFWPSYVSSLAGVHVLSSAPVLSPGSVDLLLLSGYHNWQVQRCIAGKNQEGRTYDIRALPFRLPCFPHDLQYSACFGCELVMNNTLATHFHDYFGVDLVAAGALAMSFGAMTLFARSVGGIVSDWANSKFQMCGRLWTHFISLFGQAVFLFLFGCVTKEMGDWPVALAVLIVFAIFVNIAEGTSYGIVPYMIPTELAIVSAVVGAGGTLGAVIATWAFYKNFDTFTSLKLHSAYVMFWALTCFLMRWEHLGSMFGSPPEIAPADKTDTP